MIARTDLTPTYYKFAAAVIAIIGSIIAIIAFLPDPLRLFVPIFSIIAAFLQAYAHYRTLIQEGETQPLGAIIKDLIRTETDTPETEPETDAETSRETEMN